ncbi:hypothetical protein Val02_76680 [Virgisporangium aliadipatigenens]|uniref:Uncharacterized protein n=1 Tax=Virgisporangium aliadipatigenens TaxID=741659 RepID=A0A8J3YUK7_9ACTN|nr:DUF5691 domain-containing protein [Virgisporangium aliadipatigenens]GIJ50782.1 hypothetical protein Val02_76680 [Virgisporangium aliadipatigenens]
MSSEDRSLQGPQWTDVVSAALVGTDRRPVPGGPGALLDAAAAQGLRMRAGVRAEAGVALPEAAPEETVPAAPRAAAVRLAGLLDPVRVAGAARNAETRLELVDEWLGAGRRAPGELLPELLDLGRRHRQLRPALAKAGGERARWLAVQRDEWRYLLGETDEREIVKGWDLAPIGRRVGHLSAVRRRDPHLARMQLTTTWDSETAEDRAALLKTFHIGLSRVDEDILERALDDPRREVRVVALDLLARLPDSAYALRMAVRARGCVRVDGARVDVRPPAQCDRSMQRDGVTARAPAGTGQRAWWLEEVLARTPLGTWGRPETLLDKAIDDEWTGVLRRGLGRAAAGQDNSEWAAVMVDRLWSEPSTSQRPDDRLLLEALYEVLPVDLRAERAAAVLRRDPGRATAAGVERLLELCPRPWPRPLAEAAVDALGVLIRGGASAWRLAGLTALAGTRLPVSTVDGLGALRDTLAGHRPDDPRLSAVDHLTDVLRFRYRMNEELTRD